MLEISKLNLKILFKKNLKAFVCLSIFLILISLTGCKQTLFPASDIKKEDLETKVKLENSDRDYFFDNEKLLKKDIVEKMDSIDEVQLSEKTRNPFKPFFVEKSDSQDFSNQLILVNIYSIDKIFYIEIEVNGSIYKLKKDDQFARIYQVLSINEDSIVLLKGDELITLYMNEIYYD